MKLGIVYKNGKVINHRSLLKVLINPIIRYFGFQIVSLYNEEINEIYGISLRKCDRQPISYDFKYHNDYDNIVKKRILI